MTELEKQIRRIIGEMRNERPRYKSHDLGYVDSVSASRVDEWADELETLLSSPAVTEPQEPDYRQACQRIMQVLGPSPGCSECCEGCSTEMHEAMRILQEVGIAYRPRKSAPKPEPEGQ